MNRTFNEMKEQNKHSFGVKKDEKNDKMDKYDKNNKISKKNSFVVSGIFLNYLRNNIYC